jgi:eukaryotic-like serine/threonine-protein kinase
MPVRAATRHRVHVRVQAQDPCKAGRRPYPVETAEHPTEVVQAPGRQALVLDRYRLVRRLGAGGFGVVWLAHDEHLDRAVALKRIGVAGQDPARAEREALAAARLNHTGIVALYEAGRDDDAVYLVSELVRGRTLAELIADGELSDRDVLRIGVALCDALAHAHGRGVVHRDVKPGNVIVPDEPAAGVAKLTDFGIARVLGDDALTRTGDVVGTLAYMAPEQAEGRQSGEPADLYSLAIVLYEALAGVNPVRGRGPAATARRVGARLPPLGRLRRDLPLELCEAIDIAVLPRPEQRGTLGDLRAALQDATRDVADEPGAVLASRTEAVGRVGAAAMPSRPSDRVLSACGAAALTAAALAWLGPEPLVAPGIGAAIAGVACALLPRLGWIACAVLLLSWLSVPAGGIAVVAAIALAPVPVLLRRARGSWWSAPAIAAPLDVIGGGAAWLAIAGQAARPWHRAALGALGWWAVLAGRVIGHGRGAWADDPGRAWRGGVGPVAGDGTLLAVAGVWALAALTLPLFVRGRAFAYDLVGAAVWGAGLAAGTQALAPDVGAAVLGATLAGVVAVLVRASRAGGAA